MSWFYFLGGGQRHIGASSPLMSFVTGAKRGIWRFLGRTFLSESGTLEQPIRFPGQYADSETGYHNNLYRDYDPSTGRYIQADPRGVLLDYSDPQRKLAYSMGIPIYGSDRGLNSIYGYAKQNPILRVDPTGEGVPAIIWWGLAGIGTGIGVKNCSSGYDSLNESSQNLDDYHNNMSDAYSCALSGACNPEPFIDQAGDNYNNHIKNAIDGVGDIGSSTPGTQMTGPPITSPTDLKFYGAGNIAGEALSND